MIDTTAIEHSYSHPLSANYCQLFNWQTLYNPRNGSVRGHIYEGKKDSHIPRMTYMLRENGFWYLRAEVSFPKWLKGSNVISLTENELPFAFEYLSDTVSGLSGENFDAKTGNLCRVDFVEDRWIIETGVIPFFKRAQNVTHPTMKRRTYDDTGVKFLPKSEEEYRVVKVYSKLHDVMDKKGSPEEIELARGQIRLEVSLRTRAINSYIKELRLPDRQAQTILNSQVAEYILTKEKRKLGYDALFVDEIDSLKILLESPDVKNPFGIYGFMGMYQRLGNNFHKLPFAKCSKRTYQYYLSKCRKLGLLP